MSKLRLSVAVGPYDRVRPLIDGVVPIDGVEPVFMQLEPEEIFFRAFRNAEFDICECSLSSFAVKTAAGDCPYVGVPVFPSRAFRHTSIYIRNDRGIRSPADLKGKRVGAPEYQLTANVWARAILLDEYGVKPSEMTWVRGGYETPGRVEKIMLKLADDVRLEQAPPGRTLSQMLADGELDGLIGPRAPSPFRDGHPDISYLWDHPVDEAVAWYRKRGMFPIMHLLGIKKMLVEHQPWLPATVLKAFQKAKTAALQELSDTSATKVTLPFVEEQLTFARSLMGDDFWSYGFAPNQATLDYFLEHHYNQGLSIRRLKAEELFHPASLEGHII